MEHSGREETVRGLQGCQNRGGGQKGTGPPLFHKIVSFIIFYTSLQKKIHKRPYSISFYSKRIESYAVAKADKQNSETISDLSDQAPPL